MLVLAATCLIYCILAIKTLLFLHLTVAKEGAGAVDEEDFIKAFDDVPTVQVNSTIEFKHLFKS